LTSTLGLSIDSLHLTFNVTTPTAESVVTTTTDLSASVASVADAFIHDELSSREEEALHQSFHPAATGKRPERRSENIPGGFDVDPFSHDDDDEVQILTMSPFSPH
jgi:autophagy-related protein 2